MIIEITTKRWPRILFGSYIYAIQAKSRHEGRLYERNAEYYKRSVAGIKGAATKRLKREAQAAADIVTLLAGE
jgi:hypothetical protein